MRIIVQYILFLFCSFINVIAKSNDEYDYFDKEIKYEYSYKVHF